MYFSVSQIRMVLSLGMNNKPPTPVLQHPFTGGTCEIPLVPAALNYTEHREIAT